MSVEISNQLSAIPGDVAGIQAVATRFTQTAKAIEDSVADLKTMIKNARTSESKAVTALAGVSEDVTGRLESLKTRYETAGTQLTEFATHLQTAKNSADRLVEQQTQQQTTIASWGQRLEQHSADAPRLGSPSYLAATQDHLQEQWRLRQAQNEARGALQDLQRQYEQVVRDLKDRGSTAARALNGAIKSDGLNDSVWDKVKNWVNEHAEFLKVIHKILQVVTAVLAVASFFFPVLAPFALAAAGLTAGLSWLLAASGEISWVDFGLDVLALATFGVGAIASSLVRGATQALRLTRVGTIASRGHSIAESSRRVSLSFKGVLNQTTRPGTKIPTFNWNKSILPSGWKGWGAEIFQSKGLDNANFLRLVQGAKAGASSADSLAILTGQVSIEMAKGAGTVNLIAHQVDSAFESYLPKVDAAFEGFDGLTNDFFGGDIGAGEWLDSSYDWYQDFKQEHATWKVGG